MQFNKNLLKSFLLFSLIFSFSLNVFGQSEETEEFVVPEQAMEQVVRRILIWSFKPRKKPTTIYLAAEGIKQSWLPEIKNIKFELLSDEEIEQTDGVYSFKMLEKFGNKFSIGFVFGHPSYGCSGKNWYFRIFKIGVRLWQDGEIGCSGLSYGIPNSSY